MSSCKWLLTGITPLGTRDVLAGNCIATWTFRDKKEQQRRVFFQSTLYLMSTLTWITEKELERVIKNKVNEFRGRKTLRFHSDSEKMRNASGQQGENKQQ